MRTAGDFEAGPEDPGLRAPFLRPPFEEEWRQRFGRFASRHDDDASIAGWTDSGLVARIRGFERLWRPRSDGELWLDAGCGAGTYSRLLARHGMAVIGLDYSQPSIRKAVARSGGICWIVGDVTRLPLASSRFSGALCFGVLQALAASEAVLDELVVTVRADGEIWLDALNAWCLPHLLARAYDRARGRPAHVRYESPWRLRHAMQARGLVDIHLYWLPIAPGRWRTLQRLFESRPVVAAIRTVPFLGALVSHAFILRARKPA